ncbi:GNAT family N-acetyltransferase, partial [Falsiroseomonas oryzae]|uniref:GNAT family N-acetyltransferase n=1 Tax=Falsiroseomonas oryzae TaxID=2766473 RepID=UPI0038CC1CAE
AAERHRARFAALAAQRPAEMARLRLRRLDRGDYAAEVARIAALYDDAWAENRHAVPLRPGEVAGMARLLRPLLVAGEVVFADWDGAPIGLVSIVPNIEPTLPADGRLLPLGWLPLARALRGRVDSARIPMLGIARAFRRHPASALAMGALLAEAISIAAGRGWRQVEISWILEENAAMRNAMARLPAPVTGRWRLWRSLPPRSS